METKYARVSISRSNDIFNEKYTLSVRDMPTETKPRERLLAHGPTALSIAELMAVLLVTGTKKEDVLLMASRITAEYGEGGLRDETDPRLLCERADIPLTRAMQIVAAMELGRRFFERKEHSRSVIRTPHEVFEYARSIRESPKEHFMGIYLDAHYRVLHDEIVSIGTVEASVVHPREFFRPAIEYCAVGAIAVHNHPSGVTTPSDADIETTIRLAESGSILGIPLLDHVVVTKESYASIGRVR
jgi:DNA repair protein RadC